jgi:sec-independent protein translocase protein TatA
VHLGLPELLIILAIIIIIFGASRLAGLGRGLGQAIRGFKDEVKTDEDKDQKRPGTQ